MYTLLQYYLALTIPTNISTGSWFIFQNYVGSFTWNIVNENFNTREQLKNEINNFCRYFHVEINAGPYRKE